MKGIMKDSIKYIMLFLVACILSILIYYFCI